MELILPKKYDPRLTIRETQDAIKYIRDTFQKEMGRELHLERISAPLFVEQSSGLNDNLNGVERPVQFDMAGLPGETLEVVHSLAKWKRIALKEYGFLCRPVGLGKGDHQRRAHHGNPDGYGTGNLQDHQAYAA